MLSAAKHSDPRMELALLPSSRPDRGACPVNHRRETREAGFTLLELMVVVTIMAVAAALVVPNLTRAYAETEVRMEARSVANFFLEAHDRAVFHAGTFVVVFGSPSRGRRALYLADTAGRVVNTVWLPAGIALRARVGEGDWTSDPPPVHFFPDGASEPLQLDLRGSHQIHLRLQLDPLTARLSVGRLYRGN